MTVRAALDGWSTDQEERASLDTEGKTQRDLWSVAGLALLGALLYGAALPPIAWSGIAWAALLPWSIIVALPRQLSWREWRWIWLAAWLLWLGLLYFIPIPHPALWLFWPLLAAYCALYIPAFIAAARWLHFRGRLPLCLAVPISWAGLEWVRGNFLTGFAMGFLSHSQFRQPLVIQVAELGGAYLLSFLLAMCAAFAARGVMLEQQLRANSAELDRRQTKRSMLLQIAGVLAVFLGVCFYGAGSLGGFSGKLTAEKKSQLKEEAAKQAGLQALVIQGSIDTTFPATREEVEQVFASQFQQYRDLTIAARKEFPEAQLVIWPETIFVQPLFLPAELEREVDAQQAALFEQARREFSLCFQASMGALPREDETEPACQNCLPLLTGVSAHDLQTSLSYNSVGLIGESCEVVARYDKMHRVIVGEYLPFGEWFPWIYRFTPVGRGIAQGRAAVAMELGGVRLCPSICFESTVPHLIRRQVQELAAAGKEPDVLVNPTNDGWFFGTSCLDLHLACNVFRAVEMRRPMVVAANTGFSAWIDAQGRILEQGPRRATGYFPVSLQRSDGKPSGYRIIGDWPWLLCGLASVAALIATWRSPIFSG
ncbi:MAG: apolipoprotein N-acyltransferase [Planctomycetota bacterium]